MPARDMEAFGSMVSAAVNSALAPLREKQAGLEAYVESLKGQVSDLRLQLAASDARMASQSVATAVSERLAVTEELVKAIPACQKAIAEMGDRILRSETVAALPVAVPKDLIDPHVAVAPVQERVSVAEARLDALVEGLKSVQGLVTSLTSTERRTDNLIPVPDLALVEQVAHLSKLPERLASVEAQVARIPELQQKCDDTSNKVVAFEAKASVTVPPETNDRDHLVALSPVIARVAGTEAVIQTLVDAQKAFGGVIERVVRLETREVPVQAPDTVLHERLAVCESQLAALPDVQKSVVSFSERLHVAETKVAAPAPIVVPAVDSGIADKLVALAADLKTTTIAQERIEKRVESIETKHGDAIATVTKDLAQARERLAAAEVRPLMPGPAGEPGRNGVDGANGTPGRDGADGIGFDDLSAEQIDERSFAVKASRGERVKTIGTVTFPVEIYRGVYQEGRTYEKGDCVTFGGSEWHCNEPTTAKPGESKSFTLKVKKGRDGRDGKDAGPAVPVVRLP